MPAPFKCHGVPSYCALRDLLQQACSQAEVVVRHVAMATSVRRNVRAEEDIPTFTELEPERGEASDSHNDPDAEGRHAPAAGFRGRPQREPSIPERRGEWLAPRSSSEPIRKGARDRNAPAS